MDDTDDPSGLSQYTLYETKVYVTAPMMTDGS